MCIEILNCVRYPDFREDGIQANNFVRGMIAQSVCCY